MGRERPCALKGMTARGQLCTAGCLWPFLDVEVGRFGASRANCFSQCSEHLGLWTYTDLLCWPVPASVSLFPHFLKRRLPFFLGLQCACHRGCGQRLGHGGESVGSCYPFQRGYKLNTGTGSHMVDDTTFTFWGC